MDPSLEIRKIPIDKISELIQILDSRESWKTLMAVIPKFVDSDNFVPKYGTHEMNLIENAGKTRGSCTQILFDEWGTSGIKRPTLSLLLRLLIESELFRAADFVSIKLLNGSAVKRPTDGPGAAVDVSLDKLRLEQSIKNMRMDSLLNGMSYPDLETNISNNTTFNQNLDNVTTKVIENKKFVLPVISNSQNITEESSQYEKSNITTETNIKSSSQSDMIQFSSNCIGGLSSGDNCEIPAFSQLLLDKNVTRDVNSTGQFDNNSNDSNMFQSNTDNSNSNIDVCNGLVGNISDAMVSEPNLPNLSVFINSNHSEANIPNFSIIQGDTETISENFNIPDFGALQNSQAFTSYSSRVESDYSASSVSSNIPMLSSLQSNRTQDNFVNTTLPHFTYEKLQQVTNNFEDRKIFDHNNKLLSGKIGDGGFGSVYLSRTLTNIPVAIKKLTIDYSLTDCNITEQLLIKQFKVEIEILEKCKHENILVLLGYSYDGTNHCLISEYIENGSLRDNLAISKKLTPDIRIKIAIGTAKGIDYLHNHFETPLIHRDIKSANILLADGFIPKISDFGLVKDKSSNHTVQTTKVVGTTAYMSPEAFRGDVSVKMDVFSFGVVLLELLTSLPSLDENRIGKDIVTHVEDLCIDGSIEPLLDKAIGDWKCSDKLYDITKECLEEKRKRPFIQTVYEKLCAL